MVDGDFAAKPLKVLVVGCGSIGKRHARLWTERPEAEVWVCDSLDSNLKAALAEAPGAQAFSSYEDALFAGPDAVWVCTPNHLHRPMAEAALDAGCDVLCEKPLADNVANAEALAAKAEGSGRFFAVGYTMRSHAGMRRVLEVAQSGVLGTLVGGRAMVGTYFTLMCATTPYRFEEENALIIDYTHLLDYLRLFFGDLELVSAESNTLGDLEMKPKPNMFSILMRYTSGALVQCHMDYIQHPQRHTLELYGDRGVLTCDFQTGELRLYDREKPGYEVEHVIVARADIYRVQISEFLRGLRGETTALATAEDGVAALRAAAAAVEAAATHSAVRM
ncbi:MAG: Gfo/Idh/MocA family oxidoreductase [Armatimonadetes bacterium]|nr:Gfo/Idh/MocA family oxidoreductase [Armatimonadota bacterium]